MSNCTMHNIDDFLDTYASHIGINSKTIVEPFNCVEKFIIENQNVELQVLVSLVFNAIEMENLDEFSDRVVNVIDLCSVSSSTYYFTSVPIYGWLASDQKLKLKAINVAISEQLSKCSNIHLIDLDLNVSKHGEKNLFHDRFLFMAMASYKELMVSSLSKQVIKIWSRQYITPKKCFVVDCDNTLWAGVIGEDGINGIKYSEGSYPGNIFKYVQSRLLALKDKGIILAICSKNNIDDIIPVLDSDDFALNRDDFSIIKANWNSKPNNLLMIAKELNIGLDSLVFMDDSDFEIDLVKKSLPEILTLQVPKHVYQYPDVINDFIEENFDFAVISEEDINRSSLYKARDEAKKLRNEITDIDAYLVSLQMKCQLNVDSIVNLNRVSQLTGKTNQFNFYKKVYQPHDIKALCVSPNDLVFSLNVQDRFGDLGVTNVSIINFRDNSVYIETFLMSCRVIERKVEHYFLKQILLYIFNNYQIENVWIKFEANKKNIPALNFLNTLGTSNFNSDYYKLNTDLILSFDTNYIEKI
ncbi:HAD-IIIC family phosphatase [Alphaproteobacteria bacterium]|nr:HAD-IIIC family phosphatase [Alphaproteobacteria bacterium]